jgi:hypothetical protein
VAFFDDPIEPCTCCASMLARKRGKTISPGFQGVVEYSHHLGAGDFCLFVPHSIGINDSEACHYQEDIGVVYF